MHASSCSLCLVKLLLLSGSPFHVESSTLIFSHLFWSAEMAVATVIAIPAPRSFVVVDTRFTSALLVKLPLYKARQRHLFHQRSTGWLHLSWVVWVLCRSVNLRVMATTLSVERQRHQNPRHLRAGHCEYHSSLERKKKPRLKMLIPTTNHRNSMRRSSCYNRAPYFQIIHPDGILDVFEILRIGTMHGCLVSCT